jgi:hypothetical protein
MAAPADIHPLAKKQRTDNQEIYMEEEHSDPHPVIRTRHVCGKRNQDNKDEDGNIEPEDGWINDPLVMKLAVVFDPEEGKYQKCDDK